nr:reverse transcriptase [Tanacetum cinerariifolium]
MTSTTTDTAPIPTNLSSQVANILNTSQDVDELEPQQKHVQQQDNKALLQPKIVDDNVYNAMFDEDVFENTFAPPTTSAAESSSLQYVDPSNMHTFYQPYQHDYYWTKDHPLEKDRSYQDIFGTCSIEIVHRIPNDLKTAFLHGSLKEDIYMCQPKGFIYGNHPSHVYMLKNALYGLKQALMAWYDELPKFLLHNHFNKGTIDPTLFI